MSELRADQARAIEQLSQARKDIYCYARQEEVGGGVSYKKLESIFVGNNGYISPVYTDTKRRRYLPLVEAKALREFAPWLRYFCQRSTHLHCGDITLDKVCLVADVGRRRAETLTEVRRFFERCGFDLQLVFTIIHEKVSDKRGANGELRVNVHAHFLFISKLGKSDWHRFQTAFMERFPIGSRVERVKHRGKYISYILRTPDLRPLIEAEEYVNWCDTVENRRRMSCYGSLRAKLSRWKGKRKKIVNRVVFNTKRRRYEDRYYLADRPPLKPRRAKHFKIVRLDTKIDVKAGIVIKNPSSAAQSFFRQRYRSLKSV
jgi:hypothetical protein